MKLREKINVKKLIINGYQFYLMIPFTLDQFLRELSQDFILHLASKGEDRYVRWILEVIDPKNKYFEYWVKT